MITIQIEYYDNIATVKLNREVTNAINREMVNECSNILNDLKDNPNVNGVVLTSSNEKFFSIGFDIPQLFEMSKEEFGEFYHSFNQLCLQLYTLPKPTIAAITGHAIAGGCILTLCCDYRFIADGRKLMGLNEIKLGVPVPYPADRILKELVGFRKARDLLDAGDFYESEQLLQMGLVDSVLPINQVLNESIQKVNMIAAFPKKGFQMIKQNRVERVEKQILEHLSEKETYFIECWYSDNTRQKLKEAMKKY